MLLSNERKTRIVLNYNMVPILYINGEVEKEEYNTWKEILIREIIFHIELLSLKSLCKIIIAYRPSCNIKKRTLSLQDVQHIHLFLRLIIRNYDKKVAENIKIIYCKNITQIKIKKLIGLKDIDGIKI